MLKKSLLALGALTIVMVASVFAKEISLENVKCFVSGKPAKAEAALAYKDGKIFFCCENCPGAFDKENAAHVMKANHQLVATHQYQQKGCPFSGKAVAEGTELAIAGTKVGFCCNNCKGKVEEMEDDAKIATVFGEKPFEKGFAKVEAKK